MKTIASHEARDMKILSLQQLCSSMNIKFPSMNKQQDGAVQKTKEWAKQKNLRSNQIVSANQLTLIPEIFRNEDDTIPVVKTKVSTGMSGVILLDSEAALPWVSEGNIISSDECAILILGHRCPCAGSKKCNRTNIPVKTSDAQTAIVTACMHNVGQKMIKIHYDEAKENVAVVEGSIIATTIFRDEVQDVDWATVAAQPVRFAVQTLGFEENAHFLGPPWGRSWIVQGEKCSPMQASSVQFHARIATAKMTQYLKQSGINGVYLTPKTVSNMADTSYAIVWIDKSPIELSQLLVQHPEHLGQVRVTKEKGTSSKTSRGVRCKREDFQVLFSKLRPADEVPDNTIITCMYKVQPTPVGATQEDLSRWMKVQGWQGRPIKALSEKVWLVGSTETFQKEFLTWNGQSVLIKPIKSKGAHKASPIVAGDIPKSRPHEPNASSQGNREPMLRSDPWSSYVGTANIANQGQQPKPTAAQAMIARQVDAPTEAKFKQHGEQVSQLQDAVKDLREQFERREKENAVFEKKVETEFRAVRSEVSNQFQQMSQTFQHSLERALQKQDHAMESSFAELKQIMRQSQQPNPAKKAKAEKPQENNMDENL